MYSCIFIVKMSIRMTSKFCYPMSGNTKFFLRNLTQLLRNGKVNMNSLFWIKYYMPGTYRTICHMKISKEIFFVVTMVGLEYCMIQFRNTFLRNRISLDFVKLLEIRNRKFRKNFAGHPDVYLGRTLGSIFFRTNQLRAHQNFNYKMKWEKYGEISTTEAYLRNLPYHLLKEFTSISVMFMQISCI
jgi:hypothetical protein